MSLEEAALAAAWGPSTVVGDPAGMRALADRLAKDADQLRTGRKKCKTAWDKLDASGEWVDALEFVVKANGKTFSDAASRLDDLVKVLRSSALEVEGLQKAEMNHWRRLQQEKDAREAREARAAQEARDQQ